MQQVSQVPQEPLELQGQQVQPVLQDQPVRRVSQDLLVQLE